MALVQFSSTIDRYHADGGHSVLHKCIRILPAAFFLICVYKSSIKRAHNRLARHARVHVPTVGFLQDIHVTLRTCRARDQGRAKQRVVVSGEVWRMHAVGLSLLVHVAPHARLVKRTALPRLVMATGRTQVDQCVRDMWNNKVLASNTCLPGLAARVHFSSSTKKMVSWKSFTCHWLQWLLFLVALTFVGTVTWLELGALAFAAAWFMYPRRELFAADKEKGDETDPAANNIDPMDPNALPKIVRRNPDYGLSFMPPTEWQIPQPRPPVCLPAEKQCPICPIYYGGSDNLPYSVIAAGLPETQVEVIQGKKGQGLKPQSPGKSQGQSQEKDKPKDAKQTKSKKK